MITFLLILTDISILALAYIRFQVILHNLTQKHNTTVSTLLNSCSNLSAIYDDKKMTLISSIISKILLSLVFLSNQCTIGDALKSSIIIDSLLILLDYFISESTNGFYVKTDDEIKLRKRHIKL